MGFMCYYDTEKTPVGLSSHTDGLEQFIGTSWTPDFAHHVFPCFNQTDIPGQIRVGAFVPRDWKVISSEIELSGF
jgi:hypothetical protein